MDDLAYALGDLFQWTFGILEFFGNLPNYVFMIIIMILLALWMVTQQRFIKEDRQAGRII